MIIHPEVTHGIVNRRTNTVFHYQGWPTVCRDENGTLYAVASGFRLGHVDPFGKTVMYISRNNGETWTPPIVINDSYFDDRDAGILYMGNGRMLVTWFCHPNSYYRTWGIHKGPCVNINGLMASMMDATDYLPKEQQHGGSYIMISEDYGVTWSETLRPPIHAPHGPNLCRDGSLIYLGKEMYLSEEANNTYGVIRAMKSTDGGCTWSELGTVPFPDGIRTDNFFEPHVIELPDGRLLGAIRAQGKGIAHEFTIYTTISSDGGKTWSVPECTDVSGSPPHLMMHSSGALICSFGRREAPFSERAMVSYDYGKTWEDEYVIDSRPVNNDLGYPSTVELDDGSLMTVYYQMLEGDSNASILYTKWKLK